MKKLIISVIAFTIVTNFAQARTPYEKPVSEWVNTNVLVSQTARKDPDSSVLWYDARKLTIEGRGFSKTVTPYSRLDKAEKDNVTQGVWNNGKSAAGVTVRFVTNATTISATWDNNPPMAHMAYTGSGGLDLYAREDNKWVFRGVGIPTNNQTTATNLIQKNYKGQVKNTEYLLFLPLYSSVDKLEIGISEDSTIAPAPPAYEDEKPIVFYGTSITQGGCASRAGMAHPAILRRLLDVPVINLGFSGSGKCEPAMCRILSEIPASVYVLETVPNMTPRMIDERVIPFVKELRKNHPDTPILMVESPNISKDAAANARWKTAFDSLKSQEHIENLHYLPGNNLYFGSEEPTVDGVHPTDLGFYEIATGYRPVLEKLLKR